MLCFGVILGGSKMCVKNKNKIVVDGGGIVKLRPDNLKVQNKEKVCGVSAEEVLGLVETDGGGGGGGGGGGPVLVQIDFIFEGLFPENITDPTGFAEEVSKTLALELGISPKKEIKASCLNRGSIVVEMGISPKVAIATSDVFKFLDYNINIIHLYTTTFNFKSCKFLYLIYNYYYIYTSMIIIP